MIVDLCKIAEEDITNGKFSKALEKLEESLRLLIKHKTEKCLEVHNIVFFYIK